MDQVFRQNVQQTPCNCTDKVNVHFYQFARNSLLSRTFYWNKFNFVPPNNSAPFYRGSNFPKCVPLWLFIGYFSILSNSKVFFYLFSASTYVWEAWPCRTPNRLIIIESQLLQEDFNLKYVWIVKFVTRYIIWRILEIQVWKFSRIWENIWTLKIFQ
jgi:hypothetical protein